MMKANASDIRNRPAYGPAEAARYLRLPAATLRTWLVCRAYPKGDAQATFHPLIKPASTEPLQVSFYNLVEAHVGDRKSNHPSPDIVPAATLKTRILRAQPRPLGFTWS